MKALVLRVCATPAPVLPPMRMEGPSDPAESPKKMHRRLAANIPVRERYHEKRMSPRMEPSVWGMPLPRM